MQQEWIVLSHRRKKEKAGVVLHLKRLDCFCDCCCFGTLSLSFLRSVGPCEGTLTRMSSVKFCSASQMFGLFLLIPVRVYSKASSPAGPKKKMKKGDMEPPFVVLSFSALFQRISEEEEGLSSKRQSNKNMSKQNLPK